MFLDTYKWVFLLLVLSINSFCFGQTNPKEALEEAIRHNKIKKVERIITDNEDLIYSFNECADIPILFSLKEMDLLLKYRWREITPFLRLVFECNDTSTIKKLVELDSNFVKELKYEFGLSPILIAAEVGNLWAVKYLLEKGANIYDDDYLDFNVLFYAAKSHNIDLLTFLIDTDSFLVNQRRLNMLPIHNSMVHGKSAVDVIDFLIPKLELDTSDFYRLLFDAAKVGDIESIKYLSGNNYVSGKDYKKAVYNNIRYDWNDLLKNDLVDSALRIQILEYLLDKEFDINELISTANLRKYSQKELKYLVRKGFDVNSLINTVYFKREDQKEITLFLIENKADLNLIYKREVLFLLYKTPKETEEQREVIETFWEKGFEVKSFFTTDPIVYLLHEVIIRERLEVLDYWLNDPKVKAKINFVDENDNTLLDYATSTNNRKIIKLVKSHLE